MFANDLELDRATIGPIIAETEAVILRDWPVATGCPRSAQDLWNDMHDVGAQRHARTGDADAALATDRIVLDGSAGRTWRIRSILADEGFLNAETDGVVTGAATAALEACTNQGDCEPRKGLRTRSLSSPWKRSSSRPCLGLGVDHIG